MPNLNSQKALNNDNSAQNLAPNLDPTSTNSSTNENATSLNSSTANTPNPATPNLGTPNSNTPTSGATLLDATNVTATLGDAQRPGAVTTREGVNTSTQSIDQILRTMPGSYTQMDASQGTVQVNIRGLSGQGRVNTMIDGVPQTFFGTSADVLGGGDGIHFGVRLSGTQAFGAAIDQNLIADIEMSKGTFSGGSGGNAMMGSVNFRTIGINDLIYQDNAFGVLTKYSYGSQDIGPSFMGAVAGRDFNDRGGFMGAMFAYSGSNIRQKFSIGGHPVEGNRLPPNQNDVNSVFSNIPSFTYQKPRTTLLKLEFSPDGEQFFGTNFRFYKNYVAGRKLNLDNYQLNYNYKPESDYIDTNLLFAYNENKELYDKDSQRFLYSTGGSSINKALNLDLNNAFTFTPFEESSYTFKPGVSFLNNDYKETSELADGSMVRKTLPKGKQQFYSIYFDHSYYQGIFGLNANFNLTHYKLKGQKPAQPYLNANGTVNRNNYLIDSRKKNTYLNTSLMASADIHELFMPFVSFTQASRVPNPQEAFYIAGEENDSPNSLTKAYFANPNLKKETANTYQIGFNAHKQAIFSENDNFGFKALYYHTDIKNFIYAHSTDFTMSLRPGGNTLPRSLVEYKNTRAKFKGFEVETHYDIGFLYARATYTYQQNEHPEIAFGEKAGTQSTTTFTKSPQSFTKPPRDTATFDIGGRAFDESFTLGTLIKYTGRAERMRVEVGSPRQGTPVNTSTEVMPKIPTIVDIYANYKPIRNLEFKIEVQNVFNENYIDTLDTYMDTLDKLLNPAIMLDNQARGRTFIGSFVFRY